MLVALLLIIGEVGGGCISDKAGCDGRILNALCICNKWLLLYLFANADLDLDDRLYVQTINLYKWLPWNIHMFVCASISL